MPKKRRATPKRKPLITPTPELGNKEKDKFIFSKTDPIHSVPLDYGAFMFMWDLAHRKNQILERSEYLSVELRGAARRAAEAFSDASGIEPKQTPRKSKKKRRRCPATNRHGEQCRKAEGHPLPHKI